MTDQEKATNETLEGIELEILALQKRGAQIDGRGSSEQEENGFQEALRLCRASLRARYVDEEATEEDDE